MPIPSSRPSLQSTLLVALTPGALDRAARRAESAAVLERAVQLACNSGALLDIVMLCERPTAPRTLAAVPQRRDFLAEQSARLAELVMATDLHGVGVSQQVRWNTRDGGALLTRVDEVHPDLLLMSAHPTRPEVLPVATLLDRCPVPIWFVHAGTPNVETVLAAIGASPDGDRSALREARAVLRTARALGKTLCADVQPVHVSSDVRPDTLQRLARGLDLTRDELLVQTGQPTETLGELAERATASLIVIGADDEQHLQRTLAATSPEPLLADVPCDVLFLKLPELRRRSAPAVGLAEPPEQANTPHRAPFSA